MQASNVYASRRATKCTIAECAFEAALLSLFAEAKAKGVDLQDVVVITSAALAVEITRSEMFTGPINGLRLVETCGQKEPLLRM